MTRLLSGNVEAGMAGEALYESSGQNAWNVTDEYLEDGRPSPRHSLHKNLKTGKLGLALEGR